MLMLASHCRGTVHGKILEREKFWQANGRLILTIIWRHVFDLMQDDVIDEVGELIAAAECLKENGAYKIYAAATHGVLSKNAPELIDQSPIDEVRNKTHTPPPLLPCCMESNQSMDTTTV